ncbi:ABC transporter permease [Microbacterium terricola]|uniref:Peptide ABC transporter permease n=1 Tax=Microbacterium terricola TaxID=344163 RepID=A0ABM8E1W8_9MICO|nr:ABC transporter permease [Microbacterium terricola]UYK40468.1 ABC transporter permease [Microbacterium terricola]BDV31809.1 peptide ABC transporter permease [Microbacterium terricola]
MTAEALAPERVAVAPVSHSAVRYARRASTWGALLRRPTFTLCAAIVVFWVVVAITWRWLGVDPFADTGAKLAPPSPEHWFGTDRIGRDVFARVLAGAESALQIGPAGTIIATLLGAAMGLAAGYHRSWIDQAFMRVFDVFLALPGIIFLLVVVGAFGSSPLVLALAVGVLFAPGIARIIRAEVLVEMGKDYVTSAQLQGERTGRVLLKELLPNVWPQVLVQATLSLGAAVFVASSLSFLGLAAAPPSPDWGLAVNENRAYLQGAWWTLVFPALAIASLVVSVNLIGDNLKEVLRR